MAKGNEVEDQTTGRRKRAKIQSNKHKSKKSNSINGTDNDHQDEPQTLIVPDNSETDDDEVAQDDHRNDNIHEGEGKGEGEEEEAKSSEITNRRGDKVENGDKRGKSGVTKEEKKKKKNNGKSKKSESDDSHFFPTHRISRIIKSEDSDIRITQEAVFLVNKATEKFLELLCKEAYAGAFLDRKKQVWYEHLSSVVSKRKRFDFLSDFVPEKVKAEDADSRRDVTKVESW